MRTNVQAPQNIQPPDLFTKHRGFSGQALRHRAVRLALAGIGGHYLLDRFETSGKLLHPRRRLERLQPPERQHLPANVRWQHRRLLRSGVWRHAARPSKAQPTARRSSSGSRSCRRSRHTRGARTVGWNISAKRASDTAWPTSVRLSRIAAIPPNMIAAIRLVLRITLARMSVRTSRSGRRGAGFEMAHATGVSAANAGRRRLPAQSPLSRTGPLLSTPRWPAELDAFQAIMADMAQLAGEQ